MRDRTALLASKIRSARYLTMIRGIFLPPPRIAFCSLTRASILCRGVGPAAMASSTFLAAVSMSTARPFFSCSIETSPVGFIAVLLPSFIGRFGKITKNCLAQVYQSFDLLSKRTIFLTLASNQAIIYRSFAPWSKFCRAKFIFPKEKYSTG